MEVRYVEDPEINKEIIEIVEKLKEEIVSRLHPRSVILTGSFGKGEVAIVKKNGEFKFLSDCEIIVIPYKWIFNRKKINNFEKEFYKKTGLKVEIWGFTHTLYLFFPFLNRRIKPTIANYDLKYGSKVIYGKDYLKKIPNFRPEDIPLWEGVKLLFNRMAESLEYFSLENPTAEMIFWTDKIILACQDALLLTAGKYHPSYKERNKLFQKYFSKFQGIPFNLLEMTREATKRRLTGNFENIDPITYWFSVLRVCDSVFRYVIKVEFGFTFSDYLEFQEKFVNLRKGFSLSQNIVRYIKLYTTNKFKKPIIKLITDVSYLDYIYSIIPVVYFESHKIHTDCRYVKRCLEILENMGVSCEIENCMGEIIKVWKYVR